jgi:hypothetical protein
MYGVVLSMASAGQAKLQLYAPHNGTDGNGLWVRTGWDTDYDAWNEIAIQSRSFTNNVDLRAPRFYDSNNTAYYADPDSTSVMWETKSYYLTNIAAVSDDHQFGVYFGGDRSTAYAIYREGGAWNSTFPDLRIAFHTGIKMGANAGYNGMRFYTDYDMSSQVMSINNGGDGLGGGHVFVNNTLQAAGSLRAPIFYDSNDTGYYTDPNGTSILYKTELINLRCGFDRSWDNYPGIAVRNTTDQGPQGDFRIHGLGGSSGGDFNVRLLVDGPITSLQSLNAGSAAYAPIYYDSDNTSFYFNSDASVSTIYAYNWFRSYNATGWYNETYAGGWYMQDVTWVRTYNNKSIYTGNEVAAAGNITAYYSDERLKTKTGNLDNALTKVKSLSGFTYIENDLARSLGYKNEKQQVGVSAQQVKAVLPEAVALAPVDYETLEDGTIVSKSGEDYLTVDYSRLVPLLIEAIKELTAKVEELEAR